MKSARTAMVTSQNRNPLRLGWRFWLWFLALGLLTSTFIHPSWTLPRPIHRYLFVIDITQSMNTRDLHLPGYPGDRLGYLKAALEHALLAMPCGSEAGLAVFTHKNTQMILTPLEICRHAPAIQDALRSIDWRSAWAADSHIAYGLFDAIRTAKEVEAALVFLSDGEQMPKTLREPGFRDNPGQVSGWIIGTGNRTLSPIPKLDMEGRMTGHWKISDLPRQNLTTRYRSNAATHRSGLLLSHLDEARLRRLAGVTGLGYRRLTTPDDLREILTSPATSQIRPTEIDLGPWLAGIALGIAIIVLI